MEKIIKVRFLSAVSQNLFQNTRDLSPDLTEWPEKVILSQVEKLTTHRKMYVLLKSVALGDYVSCNLFSLAGYKDFN